MIIDRMKHDRVAARKMNQAQAVSILSTIIGEIERDPNKDYSDQKVIATVKKFIANSQELEQTKERLYEVNYLQRYLPVQMSENDLIVICNKLDLADIKTWMSYLKDNFAGRYDGKVASKVFHERSKND